ncbi:hypothetical protein OSB04_015499, partial [Centaurea solstitialis]
MTSLGTLLDKNFEWVHIRSQDYHTPLTNNFTAAHIGLCDPSSSPLSLNPRVRPMNAFGGLM